MTANSPDFDLLISKRDCLDKCLQKGMKRAGSTDNQEEQNLLYSKCTKLKDKLNIINSILFSQNTASFNDLVSRLNQLSETTKEKLAALEATVDNLKTAVQIAEALDAGLEIAAGLAGQAM